MKKLTKILLTTAFCCSISACSTGLFDTDNTPKPTALSNFTPEIAVKPVWTASVNSGVGKDQIKLVIATNESTLFTCDINGNVTATDKISGRTLWKTNAGMTISAGPGAGNGIVVVGNREGYVVALSQATGHQVWKTQTSSEILAAPAVVNGAVIVKAIDGKVTTYAASDGHRLWRYQQAEPNLILRGASAPQATNDSAIVGFANGNLVKLTLRGGNLIWQQTVAYPQGSFAISRMVDIDANPYIFGKRVYAATYQGNIAALDLPSGQPIWTHDISSYIGLAADYERAYVSDAQSDIWAFNADNANIDWRQTKLEARNITGPAVMGNFIVVGDAEGYLHWLSKQDGHFVGRTKVSSAGIIATPVVSNNLLYVLTMDGRLAAYSIG